MDQKDLNIRFALLVPCYNAAIYVEQFLSNISLLVKPFDEVIFYDDASTDDTCAMLTAKGYRVIKGDENKGPGFARNKLAEISKCEWFHFHDIDDGLHPDYLVKTAAIAREKQVDVVLCNVEWYDAQTQHLVLRWEYSNILINLNPVSYTISHPVGGINGLYRKSKFIETGGFNTLIRIWEDADLHVRLAAKAATFCVIEEVLSYSLRYAQSASADQELGWRTRFSFLKEYYEIFENEAVRAEIGKQAQIVAGKFILSGQLALAKKAFQLSELCKVKVPDNSSKTWRVIKSVLPGSARIALRILQLKVVFNRNKS